MSPSIYRHRVLQCPKCQTGRWSEWPHNPVSTSFWDPQTKTCMSAVPGPGRVGHRMFTASSWFWQGILSQIRSQRLHWPRCAGGLFSPDPCGWRTLTRRSAATRPSPGFSQPKRAPSQHDRSLRQTHFSMDEKRKRGKSHPRETKRRRPVPAACGGSKNGTTKYPTGGEPGLGSMFHTDAGKGIKGCTMLPGGVLMPWVGFGTYKFKTPRDVHNSIGMALDAGFCSFETAHIYGNGKTEKAVGACLAGHFKSGRVVREDVFITTKQWRKYHGYAATKKCLETSLRNLQVDVIDLYLIHWPGPGYWTMSRSKEKLQQFGPWYFALGASHRPNPVQGQTKDGIAALRAETWRAMEDALEAGKVRAIGVSNFTVAHLETLRKTARHWPPAVNQVEFHPYLPQPELLAYCQREGIQLQAYASLGGQDAGKAKLEPLGGPLLTHERVVEVAECHGVTTAQVLLRWALQKGVCVIPKASSKDRIAANSQLDGFALDSDQMSALDALAADPASEGRLCWRTDPLRLLEFA